MRLDWKRRRSLENVVVKSEVGFIFPVTALLLEARATDSGFEPRREEKKKFSFPTKGGQAKILYTKSERLSVAE